MALDGLRQFGANLPIVGGVFGSIFGNPAQEQMQRAMGQAAQEYMAYRPVALQANMNAFQNLSQAFNPMQSLMGQMYGQQAVMPMDQIVRNPFPQEALDSMVQHSQPSKVPSGKLPKGMRERMEQIEAQQRAKQPNPFLGKGQG